MRPVDKITGEIRVYGFVGLPGQTRNDSSEQYIFINRRPATAPVIGYALREAYPPLEGNRRPIVLLFVDLPPEQVDVNVHPTKREVRFHKPANVRDTLIAAVSEALGARRDMAPLTPGAAPVPGAALAPVPGASPAEERSHAALQDDAPPATLRHLVPEAAAPPAIRPFPYPAPTPLEPTPAAALLPEHAPPPDGDGLPLLPTSPAGNAPWRWFRVVGQISGRYLLLESDDGLVILDPRATRERVLYEKLMAASREGTATSQRLLLPESVKLPPADAARLRKCLAVMQAMGFGVEDFGNDHFIVESLPQLLGNISCRELLGNIAHDIENAGTRRGSEKWREEVVAKAASRALAGMDSELGEAAAEQRVHELAATRMPYTCPRGRPTMILTSLRELERKFGR